MLTGGIRSTGRRTRTCPRSQCSFSFPANGYRSVSDEEASYPGPDSLDGELRGWPTRQCVPKVQNAPQDISAMEKNERQPNRDMEKYLLVQRGSMCHRQTSLRIHGMRTGLEMFKKKTDNDPEELPNDHACDKTACTRAHTAPQVRGTTHCNRSKERRPVGGSVNDIQRSSSRQRSRR